MTKFRYFIVFALFASASCLAEGDIDIENECGIETTVQDGIQNKTTYPYCCCPTACEDNELIRQTLCWVRDKIAVVETLVTNIQPLIAQTAEIDSKIDVMMPITEDIQTKVSGINDTVNRIEQSLTDHNTAVINKLDSFPIDETYTLASTLDTNVTSLDTKVTTVDNKVAAVDTKVTGIDAKVDTLSSDLTDHNNLVETKFGDLMPIVQDTYTVASGIDDVVKEIELTLIDHHQTIESKLNELIPMVEADHTIIADIDTTVNQIELTLIDHHQSIEAKLDELVPMVENLGARADALSSEQNFTAGSSDPLDLYEVFTATGTNSGTNLDAIEWLKLIYLYAREINGGSITLPTS